VKDSQKSSLADGPGHRLLTSRQAALRLQIGTSTLNRWADEGLVRCLRTAGGHRRFDSDMIESLLQERWQLQAMTGESTLEGQALVAPAERRSPGPLRRPSPGQPLPQAEQDSAEQWAELLLQSKEALGFRGQLLAARARLGSFASVADKIAPALGAVGLRWERGEISIVEEHLASARLTRAIAGIVEAMPLLMDARAALLATPEPEEHTLGLALAELVVREAGLRSHFIGARTPIEALRREIARGRPALVVLSASALLSDPASLEEILEQLAPTLLAAGASLVLGGSATWPKQPLTCAPPATRSEGPLRFASFVSFGAYLRARFGEGAEEQRSEPEPETERSLKLASS